MIDNLSSEHFPNFANPIVVYKTSFYTYKCKALICIDTNKHLYIFPNCFFAGWRLCLDGFYIFYFTFLFFILNFWWLLHFCRLKTLPWWVATISDRQLTSGGIETHKKWTMMFLLFSDLFNRDGNNLSAIYSTLHVLALVFTCDPSNS